MPRRDDPPGSLHGRRTIRRNARVFRWSVALLAITLAACVPSSNDGAGSTQAGDGDAASAKAPDPGAAAPMRAILLGVDDVDDAELESLRAQGFDTVVIAIEDGGSDAERDAATRVKSSALHLRYWFEIARDEALAAAHPEWMASLQGHDEWRRLWPNAPPAGEGEVVKVWPWTPILYAEVHAEKLRQVETALDRLPRPRGVFLNDLQGAPSACGCGHPLCRWTSDYGPIATATRLEPDAAARFVRAVREHAPGVEVIPVWATECEEHDGAADGACAGVECYRGACWRELAKQLEPVVADGGRLGALVTYKALGRDLPIYGSPAGWVAAALRSLRELPPDGVRSLTPNGGIVAILQGWDVTPEEIDAQVARAREAGAASHVIARHPIDASWEPRVEGARRP